MQQQMPTRSAGRVRRILNSRMLMPVATTLLVVELSVIVVTVLMRAGRVSWVDTSPKTQGVTITGPGTGGTSAGAITAYVLGAVRVPGVYGLRAGARVRDLVAAAGGLTSDADPVRTNMAAPVVDGQEVYVPRVGETVPGMLGGKVDINTASADDMRQALGITATVANHIVSYRTSHGAFTAISQLLLVPLSKTTYDRIKSLVTV